MAFALTSCFADGLKFQGPGLYRANQRVILTATGLAADVALDLGNYTGTFWTAAIADATYGTMATQVLAALTSLASQVQCMTSAPYISELSFDSDILQGAAPLVDVYTLAVDSTTLLPTYTFAANEGQLTYTIHLHYLLKKGIEPVNLSFNL